VQEKVVPQIAPFGGELIQTSLSEEDEQHLREAVRAAQAG
jgi:uncharacterized membrane protein